jgi:hypothetical protein
MIDEVSDVLGWNRKHAIKALNGKVSLGKRLYRSLRLHSVRPCGKPCQNQPK